MFVQGLIITFFLSHETFIVRSPFCNKDASVSCILTCLHFYYMCRGSELLWCYCRGCERSDITKHVLVHNLPQHTCEICGKSFRHIKNKELHLKRSAV